jgi:dihydropteroate synthase-like protein
VLIVTGMRAEDIVKEHLRRIEFDHEICILPVPVAALMSPQYIARMLEHKDLSGIDLVLIPGLIKGDASIIRKRVGIKSWKGPKNAADLPNALKAIGKIKFSTMIPADESIRKTGIKEIERSLKLIEKESMKATPREDLFVLGKGEKRLFLGTHFPMRVLAEIVDASMMSTEEIKKRARIYDASGADIIDVGMVAGGGHPKDSSRAVKAVKKCTKKIVSIDAQDPEEIICAVKAGADLILSIDAENMSEVAEFTIDTPVVVTASGSAHVLEENIEKRINQLNENIGRAKSLGYINIIADPVLSPIFSPDLCKSIQGYRRFREMNTNTPVLFGAGNVTELIDGDSIGANLLLAGIAAEVGANILLTTEGSVKTKNSVSEVVKAVKMITLARNRKSPPKDLGIDLLVMKDKNWKEEMSTIKGKIKKSSAKGNLDPAHDQRGSYRILLDRDKNEIAMVHYDYGKVKPDLILKSKEPDQLIGEAINRSLISRLEHAYYLGRELERAKIAILTGKSYVQDQELLFGIS